MPEANLPLFTLYGKQGCASCEAAEKFLKIRGFSVLVVYANGDPIVEAGVKAVLGVKNLEHCYPVLVNRLKKTPSDKTKVTKGFRKEIYAKIAEEVFEIAGQSVISAFGSGNSAPESEEPKQTTDFEVNNANFPNEPEKKPNGKLRTV